MPALPRDRSVRVDDCRILGPTEGKVQVHYRRNGQLATILADRDRQVAKLLEQFPPDKCDLGDLGCVQREMNSRGSVSGGRGVDGRTGQAGGQGDPCLRGLPCGQIAAPPGSWTIELSDDGFSGSLTVWTIRSPDGGGLRERRLAVDQGRIAMPPGMLAASTVYGYRLATLAGEAVASGEFRVLAPSEQAALKRAADERVARGVKPDDAWLETLVENQLEWNVRHFLATGTRTP